MNKRIMFFLVLIITGASIGPALARDPGTPAETEATSEKSLFSFKTDDRESIFGDRFTLKAGYKVWVAKWQAQEAATTTGAQTQANSDHPSAMNGPTITGIIKLRDYDKLFHSLVLNFTWLHDGFDFAEQSAFGNHFFANRRDYTLTAALPIWEGFGVFGGYYNSRQEFTNNPNVGGAFSPVRHSRIMDGAIIGIFGNVPVTEHVGLYGNLAYAQLKFRGICNLPNFCAETNSAQGWMNEVGVTISGPRVWRIGTELQLGFRAQIIQKNFGINATGGGTEGVPPGSGQTNQQPLHDLTYGPIFMVSAVF